MNVQRLHGVVGRDAEFVYLATIWLPELVEVRAGGLIPIARQYPGAREFVESSKKEFRGASISANAYGACQILVEAVKRAGSLDSDDSGSIGMGSRSGRRSCWSSGRTARG